MRIRRRPSRRVVARTPPKDSQDTNISSYFVYAESKIQTSQNKPPLPIVIAATIRAGPAAACLLMLLSDLEPDGTTSPKLVANSVFQGAPRGSSERRAVEEKGNRRQVVKRKVASNINAITSDENQCSLQQCLYAFDAIYRSKVDRVGRHEKVLPILCTALMLATCPNRMEGGRGRQGFRRM